MIAHDIASLEPVLPKDIPPEGPAPSGPRRLFGQPPARPRRAFRAEVHRLIVGAVILATIGAPAQAGISLRGGAKALSQSPGAAADPTGSGSQTSTPATAATAQSVQTAAATQTAQTSLQHSIQALQAMQAAQGAARAAALILPSSVPNGLVGNGLVPDSGLSAPGVANPVTTWVGANTPTQTTTTANGQTSTAVNIVQTAQQALLNWQSFNVGQNTTLNFDQSAGGSSVGNWIAFNKVAPGVAPSQILGSMTAQGQVYVINQNGIIFGGGAQVNVGALVASSLPINDNLVSRGLLNNPDLQFLFSQLPLSSGTLGPTPAFTPAAAPTTGTIAQGADGQIVAANASGQDGDVVVQPGAQITSPTTADHVGGKVALVGPNVYNGGTLNSPDGQVILAAGLEVALSAHSTNDPTLRGLDATVGQVSDPSYDGGATGMAGVAANSGLIEIPRADVTMVGMAVNQNGVIDSSTSVSLNGRVDLLANYGSIPFIQGQGGFSGATGFYPEIAGTLTLGAGSSTQILPELSSTDTVVGSQLALASLVDFQGQEIHLEAGAAVIAPGASTPADSTKPAIDAVGATLTSGINFEAGNWLPSPSGSFALTYAFAATQTLLPGEIDIDDGAIVDASGVQDVNASVTENIVTAQLLGSELANSPLQRGGPLRGQTIQVDLNQSGIYNGQAWIGTPLADVSGYINLVQHTVGELTANGGSVALHSGGAVNVNSGAQINVSGGSINYQGGMVQTSKVVQGGNIIDISQATPDRVYAGLYTGSTADFAKYGISQTVTNEQLAAAHYEQGYIQGGNGGTLTITAPSMTLGGSLLGTTVQGPHQRTSAALLTSTYNSVNGGSKFLSTLLATQATPTPGALNLIFQAQNPNASGYPVYSPTPPTVDIGGLMVVGDLYLSPELVNQDGFGLLTINNADGDINIPANVILNLAAGGSLNLTGANIDIAGNISAPDGTLSFTSANISPYDASLTATPSSPNPGRGQFTLESTGSLSTAGLQIDDRSTSATAGILPILTNGGNISIISYNADLVSGSTLDASGGVIVDPTGKITYGNGGSISVKAGQDPTISSLLGGQLTLDSTLSAFSGATGGSLSIQAPLIQIGGGSLLNGDTSGNTLWLQPDFFNQGGFASFTLNGLGAIGNGQTLPAVLIAPGTHLAPMVQSLLLGLGSGVNGGLSLNPILFPQYLRTPASLSFGALETDDFFTSNLVVRGDFVMGAGSSITTDPLGKVSISGDTATVLGSIVAPGGSISVKGSGNSSKFFSGTEASPTVDLGPQSYLSVAGVVETTPNAFGYRTGSVLAGGNITVSGNIVAEAGSVLDVSGTTGVFDLPVNYIIPGLGTQPNASRYTATVENSNGGSITLNGGQELFTDATLLGNAGGSTAVGGTLTIQSGFFGTGLPPNPTDIVLTVAPTGPTIPTGYTASGQAVIGNAITTDSMGNATTGQGYFAADSFNNGGFRSLNLGVASGNNGAVQFEGAVTLNASQSLTISNGGVIYADGSVNLNAPYVMLGAAFQSPAQALIQTSAFVDSFGKPIYFAPSNGTGTLNVQASTIDVGNLSLQGIGAANLTAANGDIRGDGTLDIAGALTLTAGQIYPATQTSFTLAAYDYASGTGSVTVTGSGTRQLPLSAGGKLNIYASSITQGGVLRAPIGTIDLGSGVTGVVPVDLITGSGIPNLTATATIAPTQSVILASGSVTSVSAVDPVTGQALDIPYGMNINGVEWQDPSGVDITTTGVPAKTVNIAGVNVTDSPGARIDIGGGGDLFAYQFVTGTGGTIDILFSQTSFAVIPGYQPNYAPYDAVSGYSNSSLTVGDQVYLAAGSGLPAGVYTLLPARYALVPGAFLITPRGASPTASVVNPDGSSYVPGYRFNGNNPAQSGQAVYSSFEVDPQSVVNSRAQYDISSANTYLAASATSHNVAIPRLPMDAGQLVFAATSNMTIQGSLLSGVATGGLGGQVDIASPNSILIVSDDSQVNGFLTLNAASLTSFGADSLLIGGYRTPTSSGTQVIVTTNDLTLANDATAPLEGPDVILVSNQLLTIDPGAVLDQGTRTLSGSAQTLLLGNSSVTGSGDGVLVRTGSDPNAQIVRSGVKASDTKPLLTVGANGVGAVISATSVILDSTYGTSFDSSSVLTGTNVSLNSGQISLELTPPSAPITTAGLVLSNSDLTALQASAHALSLLSYSSIDIYGSGQIGGVDASGDYSDASLSFHAAGIRGFDGGTSGVTIAAQNVTLDNSAGGTLTGLSVPSLTSGTLAFTAQTINLGGGRGVNSFGVAGYGDLDLNASTEVMVQPTQSIPSSTGAATTGAATLNTAGALTMTTPLITGSTGANQTITAAGAVTVNAPTTPGGATPITGLGATLAITGQSVAVNSAIQLPSGNLTLHATGGDVSVGGQLNVGGTPQSFQDLTQYTSGGAISLISDTGAVNLATGSTVSVAAQPGGGDAGTLDVSATKGVFSFLGTLLGQGGTGGTNGSFSLDVGGVPSNSLGSLLTALTSSGFTQSQVFRVRTGDVNVDAVTTARTFNLSTDSGSITVTATGGVNASGTTGGEVDLAASGAVSLLKGSFLTVEGTNFSDAGKGGSILLSAGADINGATASVASITGGTYAAGTPVVYIEAGSSIDLAVDNLAGQSTNGDTTGTLHIRAPQTGDSADVLVNPIDGTITGASASSITVEGFKVWTPAGGIIDTVGSSIFDNGTTFVGNAANITSRLLVNNLILSQSNALNVEVGAEIVNLTGDLTLKKTWDLSTYRFGPNQTPGDLVLRAAGNLIFSYNTGSAGPASLSDGFTGYDGSTSSSLWTSVLMSGQSWSYQLVAGADVSAADLQQVQSLSKLAAGSGSVLLGKGSPALSTTAQTSRVNVIPKYYQTIRTGTGDITVSAGRDVQFLDPLATVYTAGSAAPAIANFDQPNLDYTSTALGNPQDPTYAASYGEGGGNITITAQGNIAHYIQSGAGLVADSSKEMPTNWLDRQGFVLNGQFAQTQDGGNVASTSWWTDFSNFFQSVGTFGGGNVTLAAGHDISNVDGMVATNARMPAGTPDAASLVELGGGDLTVTAGDNINAGVYYVERGQGALTAGNSIVTNATRSTLSQSAQQNDQANHIVPDATTWLPTTLFLGQGGFNISANNSVLLGPVANPFLLPQGINNSYLEKTYFSTYASTDTVNVSSLGNSVTIKDDSSGASGNLMTWYQNILLSFQNRSSYATISQPWLRLAETNVTTAFKTDYSLMPPSLDVTAFSGDINLVGNLTLVPSAQGTIDLAAAGFVNGLQPNFIDGNNNLNWGSSIINLSDADPNNLPSITNPLSFSDTSANLNWSATSTLLFAGINSLFNESGSTQGLFGVIQTKQDLHAPGPLHASDSNPVHIYAQSGNISGLTLYAGKFAKIIAGRDITDIALYLANTVAGNVSVVAAGRDLIAYDANSSLRSVAQSVGNILIGQSALQLNGAGAGAPVAGDIQIGGPGTLEVLAGRNLDLGVGPNNPNGTGVGIASIGNARNPYLPFGGANIVGGAGIGASSGIDNGNLVFTNSTGTGFTDLFLNPDTGGALAARYLPDLGTLMGLTGETPDQIWQAFSALPVEQQDNLALDIFYLVLRDAGRDHNTSSAPGASTYANGYAAIAALYPGDAWQGDITLTSREIKTASGGDISLFAPGGQLTVGFDIAGNQPVDQGILTEHGGNINIFTENNVNVGTSRIFTLRGGNVIIWSSDGNIGAGASSKTVQSAPPTRVLIDPQSADVQTDLAGLATGGGIGVLETVAGAPPSDVDLIAPKGSVDAGDAGIRVSGNLNIAATQILNAGNIQVGGKSAGIPTVAAPNLGGLSAASSAAGAANNAANNVGKQNGRQPPPMQELPSIVTVEVIGYGGGDSDDASAPAATPF